MLESTKIKGKGGVSSISKTTSSGGASGGASSIDEDWSIISSSSDFDDERSTTSSDGKHNTESEDKLGSLNMDGSLFKVPSVIPGLADQGSMLSKHGSEVREGAVANNEGRCTRDDVNDGHSPLSLSLASNLEDSRSDELAKSVNVGSKIRFFET